MTCPDCEQLRRLNNDLAVRLAAASYVLSRAAERNGLVEPLMDARLALERIAVGDGPGAMLARERLGWK